MQQSNIIMKYCIAAEMQWPTKLDLQMSEYLFGAHTQKMFYNFFFFSSVKMKNVAKTIIPTDHDSYRNNNIQLNILATISIKATKFP